MSFIFTRTSQMTGNKNRMVIPMDMDDFKYALCCWKDGDLIQDAFPTLDADTREFIMTGITRTEWADMFGGEE